MPKVFIIATESEAIKRLKMALEKKRFECVVLSRASEAVKKLAGARSPDVILSTEHEIDITELCRIKEERRVPVIALLSSKNIDEVESLNGLDDFIFPPWEIDEVVFRINRITRQRENHASGEVIRCGDLTIDPAKCKVLLGDKPVILTFKEYQLLRFLASNRGKVFSREDLLNKVWGWDYYGGDRTVDVHIRRLRSKIEDNKHCFIETVRNIGYRFKEL